MSHDDIIRMAREAGFPTTKHLSGRHDIAGQSVARFARFAALVAAAEREACAQIVEREASQYAEPVWAVEIVNDIRAMGQA